MSRGMKLKKMKEQSDLSRLPRLAIPSQETLADPASLFLHLTSWTVPHGGEGKYYADVLEHVGFLRDAFGNWFLDIKGEKGLSSTCFAAHLDTCDWDAEPITRFVDNGVCKSDGKTILGADDRAGVAILLYMATRDVPGLYYLFVGEEKGCIGSGKVAAKGLPERIKRCISFDRKGTTSVVTHQCGARTCSREFAQALANELNAFGLTYEPDNTGVFTDSREFADDVPECTNLSVGYYDMHSFKERQDLNFLTYLCETLVTIDWEALPVERVPGVESGFDWDDDDGYTYQYDGWRKGDKSWDATAMSTAYDAVDELVENFLEDLPCDPTIVGRLVMNDRYDTVEMIELLLDDLQRKLRRKRGYE